MKLKRAGQKKLKWNWWQWEQHSARNSSANRHTRMEKKGRAKDCDSQATKCCTLPVSQAAPAQRPPRRRNVTGAEEPRSTVDTHGARRTADCWCRCSPSSLSWEPLQGEVGRWCAWARTSDGDNGAQKHSWERRGHTETEAQTSAHLWRWGVDETGGGVNDCGGVRRELSCWCWDQGYWEKWFSLGMTRCSLLSLPKRPVMSLPVGG